MSSLDSRTGKRKSRKRIEENKKRKMAKSTRPITVISVGLCLFGLLLLAFFNRALTKGIEEETKASDYNQVKKAMEELDGIDIFLSNSYDFLKNSHPLDQSIQEDKDFPRVDRQAGLLDNEIKLYLRSKAIDQSKVGFVYYNLKDTTYMGLNEGETFFAASTSKVPIVMYLFDLAHQGMVDLDTLLMVEDRHLTDDQSLLTSESLGSTFSLYELAEMMITHSDNTATNMIYGFIGSQTGEYALDGLERLYGISSSEGNYMTPDDAIMVLNRIYKNEEANPYYLDLLTFMKNTVLDEYFTLKLSAEEIAHKTGDFDGYLNDMGIVYDDMGTYAFAVYTDNIEGAGEVLIDLGEIVQNWHRGDLD